jgi:hypothetical protein
METKTQIIDGTLIRLEYHGSRIDMVIKVAGEELPYTGTMPKSMYDSHQVGDRVVITANVDKYADQFGFYFSNPRRVL